MLDIYWLNITFFSSIELSTLQAHLLKFHEEISPKKQEFNRKQLPQEDDEENKFLSICISVAFYFLKICVFLIGPALFPAVIYCIEGSSQLFWQVTAVSCIITLLLGMMVVTMICISAEKVQSRIKEMLKVIRNNLYNITPLRHLWDILTSDFMKMNIHKILYPVVLMFITGIVAYLTYTRQMWISFYASLVTSGFITGILSTILCDFLESPELLPFHSPCKIKMAVITPTPDVKRELVFKSRKDQILTPVSRFSETNETSRTGGSHVAAQNVTSALPNYSSSICHGEKNQSSNGYQLPINFSNFFRMFQSGWYT